MDHNLKIVKCNKFLLTNCSKMPDIYKVLSITSLGLIIAANFHRACEHSSILYCLKPEELVFDYM